MFLVDIQVPQNAMGGCYGVLSGRRGHVFGEEQRPGTPMMQLKAYLPVAESFGFDKELRSNTGGKAFPQCVFDHWQALSGDALDVGGLAGKMVTKIRTRKEMKSSGYEHRLPGKQRLAWNNVFVCVLGIEWRASRDQHSNLKAKHAELAMQHWVRRRSGVRSGERTIVVKL